MKNELKKHHLNRRGFMRHSGQGAAALAALTSAPAVLSQPSPNEVIGVGHVGCGVRGGQLVHDVAGEPERGKPGIEGTQVRAISEIYEDHMEKGVKRSNNPNCKRYPNYEDMLADEAIDAVVIATPDHWHSKIVIDAANAGKDIYVEKCWTRTLPEAKAMYKAVKKNKTVMQLGHDRSSAAALQAMELINQKMLGDITLVEIGTYRNREKGKDEWRWYGFYNIFERPDEAMVRKKLDWTRFLGSAPYHPFSMERFWHWRCYWDYGTGISGDLLSHAYDFVNYILKLGIPKTCTTAGSLNWLNDGRECPDTWHSIFDYPQRQLTLTYASTFNSQQQSMGTHDARFRGKDAMMTVGMTDFEVFPETTQKKHKSKDDDDIIARFDASKTPEPPSHMQDFINCVRSRQKPKDNEDEAFAEAVTCIMSVESYFRGRTVTWDAQRQEIV